MKSHLTVIPFMAYKLLGMANYDLYIYIITLVITKYEIKQNTELFGKVFSVESNHIWIVIVVYL